MAGAGAVFVAVCGGFALIGAGAGAGTGEGRAATETGLAGGS
jgi:hypothetical protein